LSGGQRARISLARALYSNKDIYILDDILSALDINVSEFIMSNTIKGYLKGKTIIMPTHAVNFLDRADQIVRINKG
jgi:ABC-type transport system involved in cytochrome bd biosynthesis fused ATPase/permease subunit